MSRECSRYKQWLLRNRQRLNILGRAEFPHLNFFNLVNPYIYWNNLPPSWVINIPSDISVNDRMFLENKFEFSDETNLEALWVKIFCFNHHLNFYLVTINVKDWDLFTHQYAMNCDKLYIIPRYWSLCTIDNQSHYRHMLIISSSIEFMRCYSHNLIPRGNLDMFIHSLMICSSSVGCPGRHYYIATETPPSIKPLLEPLVGYTSSMKNVRYLLSTIPSSHTLKIITKDSEKNFLYIGNIQLALVRNKD